MSDPAAGGRSLDGPPLGGRLHPSVLLIWPLGQLLPLAFIVLAGGWNAVASGALAAVAVVGGLVRWWRFTWRVDGRTLVIEQGLLARRRRVLPFERIQSVDLLARLRHRVFGVVEVRLEAVGGSETEGALDAVSVADAERLRATILGARTAGAEAGAPTAGRSTAPPPLVRMRPGDLVRAGLTGGRVGVAAALFGGAQQLFGDRIGPLGGGGPGAAPRDLVERLAEMLAPSGIALVVVVALVAGFLLSVTATVVAYWDFTLTRVGDELRVRRGLLAQRQATIPLRRVQAVRVEENLPRRLLGLAAVKADVAGKAGGDDARDTGVLLPLGPRGEAHRLVAALLDEEALADLALQPMPRRARTRRLGRAVAATALVAAPAVLVAGAPGAAALLVGVPAWLLAVASYRALGHAEAADHLVARSGVLVRRTAVVPINRLQSLALRASPAQRRLGLATLDLQIARSPGVWSGPQLRDLDHREATALLRRLATRLTPRPATVDRELQR